MQAWFFERKNAFFLSDSHLLIKVKHDNACFASLLRRFFFCEQGFFWRELTENYSVFQEKKRLILRKLFLLQLFAWHKKLEMRHPWIVPFGFNGAHLLSGVEYGSFRCWGSVEVFFSFFLHPASDCFDIFVGSHVSFATTVSSRRFEHQMKTVKNDICVILIIF